MSVFCIGKISEGWVYPTGTAFVVGANLLATAGHVSGIQADALALIVPHPLENDGYQDTTRDQLQTIPVEVKYYDPVRDLAILQTKNECLRPTFELGSADNVSVSSSISTCGFPHAPDGRLVSTVQNADVGAKILLQSNGLKLKHIVLNTQTRPGQSGSPVIERKTGKVVAIILGGFQPQGGRIVVGAVDPAVLHQTTHAICAGYLKDML